MDLSPPALRDTLRADALARREAHRRHRTEPNPALVVKFFSPLGAATWLATEIDADGDTLFGLADLGLRCPELGAFSLRAIAAFRLPFGRAIERDVDFASDVPLSKWADTARREGSIFGAATARARRAPRMDPDSDPLPPSHGGGRGNRRTRFERLPHARRVPAAPRNRPRPSGKTSAGPVLTKERLP